MSVGVLPRTRVGHRCVFGLPKEHVVLFPADNCSKGPEEM